MDLQFPHLLAQAAGSPFGSWTFLLYMGGLFLIMYFVMIRPQQRQAKEHRTLLQTLKKGDDVVTQSGIVGKVYAVMDKLVVVEIANGVRVKVLKTAIQARGVVPEETAPAKADETKKEEK